MGKLIDYINPFCLCNFLRKKAQNWTYADYTENSTIVVTLLIYTTFFLGISLILIYKIKYFDQTHQFLKEYKLVVETNFLWVQKQLEISDLVLNQLKLDGESLRQVYYKATKLLLVTLF